MNDKKSGMFNFPHTNVRDIPWLGFEILLFIAFYYGFLSSTTALSYGSIYIPIFFFAIILISISLATNGRIFGQYTFGSINESKTLYRHIAIGLGFGGLLIFGYLSNSHLLAFVSPPLLSISGVTLAATIVSLIIVQMFGAEIEEFAIQSAFIPTIFNFLKTGSELPIIFFFVGLLSFIIGAPLLATIALFVVAAVFAFNPQLKLRFSNISVLRVFSAFILGAFVFALFHVYAYGTGPDSLTLFESAFGFCIMDSMINWYNGSTISGRMAHSLNNGALFTIAMGLPWQYMVLVEGIYILIIIIVFHYSTKIRVRK